jgi:hypothetical protein
MGTKVVQSIANHINLFMAGIGGVILACYLMLA